MLCLIKFALSAKNNSNQSTSRKGSVRVHVSQLLARKRLFTTSVKNVVKGSRPIATILPGVTDGFALASVVAFNERNASRLSANTVVRNSSADLLVKISAFVLTNVLLILESNMVVVRIAKRLFGLRVEPNAYIALKGATMLTDMDLSCKPAKYALIPSLFAKLLSEREAVCFARGNACI